MGDLDVSSAVGPQDCGLCMRWLLSVTLATDDKVPARIQAACGSMHTLLCKPVDPVRLSVRRAQARSPGQTSSGDM